MSTLVEKYLDSKKLDYRVDGDQAIITPCPFCGDDRGGKFFINLNNWLYNCHTGICGVKGNEVTFKRKFGDTVQPAVSNFEDEAAQVHTAAKKSAPEVPPDPEIAHKALLADDEILNYLNDERGLSLETVKLAKLGLDKRRFSDGKISRALTFPYFKGKKLLGVKYKSLPPDPKDFRSTAGWDVGLYMEDNIRKDMESLIICEGETDVLALINQGYTNVVGISGADSKKADWADLLDIPKKLYLVLDNDEAGVEGAKKFTNRFGVDRFHIVNIPHEPLDEPVVDKHGTRTTINDVNEYFQIGHTKEDFDQLLEEARPLDIEGVTTMDEGFDEILEIFRNGGSLSLPFAFKWQPVTDRAKGLKFGDMVTVLASPKCGKTTWCLNQTEFMAATYGHNIHFDCMEMGADELLKKWAAMVLDVEEDLLTEDQIIEAKRLAKKRPNGFIFTRSHPTSLVDYVANLKRVKRRYATDVIVIDNFQILVDLTIGKNDGKLRANYMSVVSKTLKALADEIQVVIILISQPRNIEEGMMVTVNHSEGSSTLKNDSDLFFTFNRNPEAKMKLSQADSIGNLETSQSHSENMYVEVGLSRRSRGGFCTLKIDGARSIIREFNDMEANANTKKVLAGGIEISEEAVSI